MEIVHAFADSRVVSGVNQSIWQLCAAQAAMRPGDGVTVLTFDPRATAPAGVRVILVRPHGIPGVLARLRPDVLHLHSVLRPSLAIATLAARRLGLPVVSSPRGGYAPGAIARRPLLKRAYTRSVELSRIRGTDLFLALTDREARNIVALHPGATVLTVGNGVAPLAASPAIRQQPPDQHLTLTYMGRSDVEHKGLDRLVRLAGELPEAQVWLHGDGLDRLRHTGVLPGCPGLPGNVHVMGVADGSAKAAALAASSCYLQLSRWEAYGRSIVEAMGLGRPVAVSAECDLADEVRRLGLGLVLADADDPVGSARAVRQYLDSPLAEQSARRAREWSLTEATPAAVARRIARGYALVTSRNLDRLESVRPGPELDWTAR
jgi:glycosyltransferase involved in cell wall biosynthesis